MRNRGRKNYLKPVRHDILLIELMYHVFSFIAPLLCIDINNTTHNLSNAINWRDILAILLTSKNWSNLFKNYVIILAKYDAKRNYYIGFKASINTLSQHVKLGDYKHKPWYKHMNVYTDNKKIFVLNQCIVGRYHHIFAEENQYYAVGFNLSQVYIQIPYTNIYSVIYYPVSKTEFKYILHASCDSNSLKTVLFVTYDLPNDHPDWTVINYIITSYKLFE